MFNEPSEIFEAGTVKKLLPHGKSGAGIRSPEHDNETRSNKRIKSDPMDVLHTGVDATAIKDKIIANVRKLDKDHRINAKAMTCWNELARDLTMLFTDKTYQGLTIEEHEVN
jgi:hypothetical protein